jgi:hypothetical protein
LSSVTISIRNTLSEKLAELNSKLGTKIIIFDSYSKEFFNGIIFVSYTSYFIDKFNDQNLSQNVQ